MAQPERTPAAINDSTVGEVPPSATPVAARSSNRRNVALVILAFVAAIFGVVYVVLWRGRESTDDAQVDADVVAVPARVGGVVIKVLFTENQRVEAGQPLADLDAVPLQAKLDQAEAALAQAEAQAQGADADAELSERSAVGNRSASRAAAAGAIVGETSSAVQLREGEAQLTAADASLQQANQDRDRQRVLVKSGAATQANLDQSETAARVAAANLNVAKARLDALHASVNAARSRVDEANARANQANDVVSSVKLAHARADAAHASAKAARAQRDLAALDLQYAHIVAPAAGVVSKKSINIGQQLVVGQAVVQLVPDARWILANFKETQIAHMRVDQPVEIRIDALSDDKIEGTVESFAGATGSRFALLPPDNASGNFTKVVQRVPVRVTIKGASPKQLARLRPGMNADITVDVRHDPHPDTTK